LYNFQTLYPGGIYVPQENKVQPVSALYSDSLAVDSNGDLYNSIRGVGLFKNGVFLPNSYFDTVGSTNQIVIDSTNTFIYMLTNNRIVKVRTSDGTVTPFAGGIFNGEFSDGVGSNARFYVPSSLAFDYSGSNLYICDQYNQRIRVANLLTSNVTTILGNANPASIDGIGVNASLLYPAGIVVGKSGLVYINENVILFANQTTKLRVYNPRTNRLSTLGAGPPAYTIAVNPEESIFYGNYFANVQAIEFRKELELFAGGTAGYVDSNAGNARFSELAGISFYGNSLLVADRGNYLIRSVDSTAIVRTYAGSNSINRNLDGVTPFYINIYSSKFSSITSACVDLLGNIYVADAQYIRLVSSVGVVSTISSNFSNAGGMTLDPSGQYIYISDTGNHKIKRLTLSNYSITDIAGTGSAGYTDASSTVTSTITTPIPLSIPGLQLWLDAADPNGNSNIPSNGSTISTWVDKSTNFRNAIATGTNTYTTSSLNGLPGIRFSDNAVNRHYFTSLIPANTFNDSISVFIVYQATEGQNNGYCSPFSRMSSTGEPTLGLLFYIRTTFGGFYPYPVADTHINPTLVNIQYNSSTEPLVMRDYINGGDVILVPVWDRRTLDTGKNPDSLGSNFVIGGDRENGYINGLVYEVLVYNTNLSRDQRQSVEGYIARKWGLTLPVSHPYYSITPTNIRYTIAPIIAQFNNPTGLCISANNVFLYVSDSGNNVIRQICFSNATTSLLIGNSTSNGYSEGVGGAAVFSDPRGLQLNSNGSMLYVVDRGNSIIRQIVSSRY
jgi:sugar lactone lactonase YvrE